MAGDSVLTITDDNFQAEVVDSGSPVLLDFYAQWCGPCKRIAPMIEELADKYQEQGLKVGKVDIDVAQELAVRFGIQGVPTIMFFKNGERVDQLVGGQPQEKIEACITNII